LVRDECEISEEEQGQSMILDSKQKTGYFEFYCKWNPGKVHKVLLFFLVGWDLRHQVLWPLLAYCTAPDDMRVIVEQLVE
jgi:hypothetical protein